MATTNAQKAKIMMSASRIKRTIDRAQIPCLPLAALVEPKPEEVDGLRALLNQCMASGGDLAVEAENLWDLLGLTVEGDSAAHAVAAPPAAPKPAPPEPKAAPVAPQGQRAAGEPQAEKPAKKKGLFGWLAPEKPDDEGGGDDGSGGDGSQYKGGLR